jgi:hypothetical protein
MSNRSKMIDAFAAMAVIALAVVVLNRVSVGWAVGWAAERTGDRVAHAAWNTSPFVWEMDHAEELHLRPSQGVEAEAAGAGEVRLETTTADPYLFLDLGGAAVPAAAYPIFEARWTLPAATNVQLHFWEPGNGQPRASQPVTLPPGPLEFRWDLRAVPFHRVTADGPKPSEWGGTAGTLDRFRVDFGDEAYRSFAVDRIALMPPPGGIRWVEDLEALRTRLESGEPLPAVRAADLHEGKVLPDAPWVRVLFLGRPEERSAPAALDPRAFGTRCIGCLHRPMGFPVKDALALARAWAGRITFYEVNPPWPTPERMLLWHRTWEASAGPPVFPRRVRAKDVPRSRPAPVPGRAKRTPDLEPVRWGAFAGAVVFCLLASALRLRGHRRWEGGVGALEVLGVWFVVQSVLAAFTSMADARFLAALWLVFGFILLSVARAPRVDAATAPATAPAWRRALEPFGLTDPGHVQANLTTLGATLVGLAGLWIVGATFEAFRLDAGGLASFPGYLGKALVQQLLLGPFLALRFLRLFGHRRNLAAAASAVVFASIHLPNFTFTASTLLMGFFWASLYLRHGRLVPLVLSHATLGTALSCAWTAPLVVSHHVGATYFLG